MTAKEFQALLSKETGYKVGMRQNKGSMKAYITFRPGKGNLFTPEHIEYAKGLISRRWYADDYSIDVHKENFNGINN